MRPTAGEELVRKCYAEKCSPLCTLTIWPTRIFLFFFSNCMQTTCSDIYKAAAVSPPDFSWCDFGFTRKKLQQQQPWTLPLQRLMYRNSSSKHLQQNPQSKAGTLYHATFIPCIYPVLSVEELGQTFISHCSKQINQKIKSNTWYLRNFPHYLFPDYLFISVSFATNPVNIF